MVAVKREHVNVDDPNSVQIENDELADLVTRDKSKAAEEFSTVTNINPDDLTVDRHGKVIVNNATFRAEVDKFMSINGILNPICININGCN